MQGILQFNDFSQDKTIGFCKHRTGQEYWLKRICSETALRIHADPEWDAKKDDDIEAYRNLSSIWEVCFSEFARMLMPERVPEVHLCQDGDRLYAASARIPDFFNLYDLNYRNTNGLVMVGMMECMIIADFLGDHDSLSLSNTGFVRQGRQLQTKRIDFDAAGIFLIGSMVGRMENLSPERFNRTNSSIRVDFSSVHYDPNEKTFVLDKLAKFDLAQFSSIWEDYKPMLRKEALQISKGDIRDKIVALIDSDMPLQKLRERQEEVKDYLGRSTLGGWISKMISGQVNTGIGA